MLDISILIIKFAVMLMMMVVVMVMMVMMVFSVCIRHLYLTGFLLLCLFRLLRLACSYFQLFFILIHITLPKNAM